MVAMGVQMHAESPRYNRLCFSTSKADSLCRHMIESTLVTRAPGGAFVAEKGGAVIGMIMGFIFAPFFTDEKVASDYCFYIMPDHRRKSRAAILLLNAFEQWARDNDAVDLLPGTTTMIDTESTASFYVKMGYEKQGYIFHKRLR